MIQYHKFNVSERGIDVNKTRASQKCLCCGYWFFKDIGFKFDDHFCNKCHDLLTKAHSSKNIIILNVKGNTYRCILIETIKQINIKNRTYYKMETIKQINIKNRTYYFYNDIINLDEFDESKIKVDKKDFNDIDIYYLGYEYQKKITECKEKCKSALFKNCRYKRSI